MTWLEPVCGLLVLAWMVGAWRRLGSPVRLILAFAFLFLTSWVSEEAAIRLYGFYGYAPVWRLFLGHVPVMVATIWPVVVLSAWGIARAALPDRSPWVPLAGAGIVFTDAALIEPVSVAFGLWSWTRPGLLEVPVIGVLGWAFYGGVAMVALDRLDRGGWRSLPLALAVPVATHALLLAAWWGLFRWVEGPIPVEGAVPVAWVAGLVAAVALRRVRLPRAILLERVPAALFFGGLLVAGRLEPGVWAWALASTPAWLVLTWRAGRAAA